MVLPVVVLAIVLIDGHLVESRQVALIDAQLSIEFVAWFYKSVGEEGINGFLCHADFMGLEMYPAIRTLGIDADFDIASLAGSKECPPCCGVHLHDTILCRRSKKFLSPTLQLRHVSRSE